MQQYLDLCKHVLDTGNTKNDRTGTGTKSVFGHQMRFDLNKGFPLMTTKEMSDTRLKSIIVELLWFIDGDTNIQTLVKQGVNIWNRDAYKHYAEKVSNPLNYNDYVQAIRTDDDFAQDHGDLGPVYGRQWTKWIGENEHINQINNVIKSLKENPDSRRHIVTAWNPSDIESMTLPPCHTLFQFYVADGRLSCQLYQRSADIFLGLPFNIASYAILTMMIAKITGLKLGDFIHTSGDAHIYTNHIEQIQTQLGRTPYDLPTLVINPAITSINDFTLDDFTLCDYKSHPAIKGTQSF